MHGGGPTRTAEAAILLAQAGADIAVLSEFRAARGSQVLAALSDAGLPHAASAPPSSGGNTVTIASRWPLADARPPASAPNGRALMCAIPALGLSVLGVHIPDESAVSARDRAWAATLAWGREHHALPALIAGDFNTSRAGIDPPRDNQTCEHCLGVLESLGFADVWRRVGCPEPGISWFGPRGERQRLDAVFASRGLAHTVESASYHDSCVQQRVSDHAMLHATFRLETPLHPHTGWLGQGA